MRPRWGQKYLFDGHVLFDDELKEAGTQGLIDLAILLLEESIAWLGGGVLRREREVEHAMFDLFIGWKFWSCD